MSRHLIIQIWEGIKMKEPSMFNLLHQWILTWGCHMFAIHSTQCSTLFSQFLDSLFLLGCNSITSSVLWQFAPSFQSRDVQAGRVGATEVHMFKFKPNPRRMHTGCCVRPFFKEISCVVVKHLKQRAFFLFSGPLLHFRLTCGFKFSCKC